MSGFLIKLNKISIAIPVALTFTMLLLHFMTGAIKVGKVEMAEKRMERLSQLSLAELGKVRVET